MEEFWSDSKEDSFLWVEQIGLIHYLVICLCLFCNYLSVSKFNFLLIFLLLLRNINVCVVLGWFWYLYLIFPFFIKTMLQFIKLLHMYVLILIISITSPFLSTGIWRNFSSSSVVSVVPFSLTEFSVSSCYSLISYVLKPAELFRVASLRIVLHICSCVLSAWSFSSFWAGFA